MKLFKFFFGVDLSITSVFFLFANFSCPIFAMFSDLNVLFLFSYWLPFPFFFVLVIAFKFFGSFFHR